MNDISKYRIKKVGPDHTPEVVINGVWSGIKLLKPILLCGSQYSEENARLIIEHHKMQNSEPEYIYID